MSGWAAVGWFLVGCRCWVEDLDQLRFMDQGLEEGGDAGPWSQEGFCYVGREKKKGHPYAYWILITSMFNLSVYLPVFIVIFGF